MAQEITTGSRAAMLSSMRPSKDQLKLEEYQAHRGRISFELERVSTKVDRFGWGQMADEMKKSLLVDWADVLDPYRLEEVKAACAHLLGENPKLATNEQQVKKVIVANRAKAFAKLPKQQEPEPAPRAEFDSDAIVREVAAKHSMKEKSYEN